MAIAPKPFLERGPVPNRKRPFLAFIAKSGIVKAISADQSLKQAMPTQDFKETLSEIPADATFSFECGPETPCFNTCCHELALPITPYDALRLRVALNIDGMAFARIHLASSHMPDCGLPLPYLKMAEMPGEPCPFLSPAGCLVYEDRPGACRAYPLGRGASICASGTRERFFLAREPHCCGFDSGPTRSPRQWMEFQGLDKYNYFNDLYMRLASMCASGGPVSQNLASMAFLALYQTDRFKDFILEMKILPRLGIGASEAGAMLGDSLHALEKRLEFGFAWLELLIFGRMRKST